MDRELLKNQAASRRNHVEAQEERVTRKIKWTCDFCSHDFASERTFMNHRCKERARMEELQSPIGQSAYAYYSEWMRLNRRSVPPIETFSISSFYPAFIKFAHHVHRVNLPTPYAFIKAMVDNGNVQPSLWCRDNVYALYMQTYDATVPPTKQFIDSVDYLLQLASDYNVEPAELFNEMGVEAILKAVQKRKLSPWFLVASSNFRNYMKNQSPEDSAKLEAGVQVGAMIMRIQASKKSVELLTDFSKATKEIGL